MTDALGDRTEMSAAEYRAYLAGQGQTLFVPVLTEAAAPEWRTNEKAFLQRVTDFAIKHGHLAYHTHKSANSAPGFPDLVTLRGGVLRFAELKVGGNKPTKQQQVWLDGLDEVEGAVSVHLWYPDDWMTIEEVLR